MTHTVCFALKIKQKYLFQRTEIGLLVIRVLTRPTFKALEHDI
jgi:hypothetical protein